MVYYTFEWGKKAGQRVASGIFTYTHPSTPIEREHNKEALRILAIKRAHLILDWQAIGTGLIPIYRLQANFPDFYADYVERNKRFDPRRLPISFTQFKRFINGHFLSPHDLTADLCLRFRQYLLDNYNGYTPGSYFARFKRVIKDAAQQGYFRIDPCANISIKNKDNIRRKNKCISYFWIFTGRFDQLDIFFRFQMFFCCYTGLRWCDVQAFSPSHIKTAHINGADKPI